MNDIVQGQQLGSKPRYGPLIKIAVLSIMLLQYSQGMTGAALGVIREAFPEISSTVIKQIQTIPTLVMIVSTLAIIPLAKKLRKKTVLTIAMLLLFFGGVLPAFGGGMTFILICRVFFGFGYGMIYSLASSFIVDLFEGTELKKMMGWKTTAGAIGGIFFNTVGGILAAIFWRYVFWGFLVAIPFMILIWWKVPEPPVSQLVKDDSTPKPVIKITRQCWIVIILALLAITVFSAFFTNGAIMISEKKIGSAVDAAFVGNFFTIGIIISSFTYGWYSKIIRNYTLAICCAMYAAVMLVLAFTTSITVFYLGGFIFGLAFGAYNPCLVLTVSEKVDPVSVTSAIAIFVAGQGLGQFLQPFFHDIVCSVTGLTAAFGESAPFISAGVILAVSSVVMFFWAVLVMNKRDRLAAEKNTLNA